VAKDTYACPNRGNRLLSDGLVPLSKTGAELLFELISQRYERGSTMITSNLPFDEWTFAGFVDGMDAPSRRQKPRRSSMNSATTSIKSVEME